MALRNGCTCAAVVSAVATGAAIAATCWGRAVLARRAIAGSQAASTTTTRSRSIHEDGIRTTMTATTMPIVPRPTPPAPVPGPARAGSLGRTTMTASQTTPGGTRPRDHRLGRIWRRRKQPARSRRDPSANFAYGGRLRHGGPGV